MFTYYRRSLGSRRGSRSSLSMLRQFCKALFHCCDSHLFLVFPQGLVRCCSSRPFADWLVPPPRNPSSANPPCAIWNEIRMPTTSQYGLLFSLSISHGMPLFILVNDSMTCVDQLLGGDVAFEWMTLGNTIYIVLHVWCSLWRTPWCQFSLALPAYEL